MSTEASTMNVTLNIQVPAEQQKAMLSWLATLDTKQPKCFQNCRFQVDVSFNIDICKEMRPPRLSRKSRPKKTSGGNPCRSTGDDEQDSGDQSNLTSKEEKVKKGEKEQATGSADISLPRADGFKRDYQRVKRTIKIWPRIRTEYCYYANSAGRSPYPRLRGTPDEKYMEKGFLNQEHHTWFCDQPVLERVKSVIIEPDPPTFDSSNAPVNTPLRVPVAQMNVEPESTSFELPEPISLEEAAIRVRERKKRIHDASLRDG